MQARLSRNHASCSPRSRSPSPEEASGWYGCSSRTSQPRRCTGGQLAGRIDDPGETELALRIEVVDNQIEAALKALKKRMERDGAFKEMKRRAVYEKPSVRRKRKQAQAPKRRRRTMQRDRGRDGD